MVHPASLPDTGILALIARFVAEGALPAVAAIDAVVCATGHALTGGHTASGRLVAVFSRVAGATGVDDRTLLAGSLGGVALGAWGAGAAGKR